MSESIAKHLTDPDSMRNVPYDHELNEQFAKAENDDSMKLRLIHAAREITKKLADHWGCHCKMEEKMGCKINLEDDVESDDEIAKAMATTVCDYVDKYTNIPELVIDASKYRKQNEKAKIEDLAEKVSTAATAMSGDDEQVVQQRTQIGMYGSQLAGLAHSQNKLERTVKRYRQENDQK